VFDSGEAPSFQHTFRAFLELCGHPIPIFEAEWHGFEVDAYYEDHRLIIELDGYRDHSLPDRFEAARELRRAGDRAPARDAADHLEATDPQAR
jgi:hypothetical protein